MNKHNLKFLRNEVIEEVTARRIREYESKTCTPVMFPVPVEEIIEQVLGLDFDWVDQRKPRRFYWTEVVVLSFQKNRRKRQTSANSIHI